MRKTWKRLIALALVGLMAAGLTACDNAPAPSGDGDGGISGNVDALLWLSSYPQYADQMMAEFEKKYPNISVDLNMCAGDTLAQNYEPRIASGQMPEVISVNFDEWSMTNADKGYIADIGDTKAFKEQRKTLQEQLTSPGGVKYGVAYGVASMVIYYNKDLFEKAGITETPKNYTEFIEVCQKLKDAGITPLAWTGGFPNVIQHGLISSGIANNLYREDKDIATKMLTTDYDYNVEGWVDIFEKMVEMRDKGFYNDGYMSTDNAEQIRLLSDGEVAMAWNGSWSAGDFLTLGDHVGCFIPPMNAEGDPLYGIFSSETGFGMGKGSEDNEAAKAFFEFLAYDNYVNFQNTTGTIPTFENMEGCKVDERLQKVVDEMMGLEGNAPLAFQMLPAAVSTASMQFTQDVLTGTKQPSDVGSVFNPLQKEAISSKG